MTALTVVAADVAPVRVNPAEQYSGPAAETIAAGQYVRFNTTNGKVELGKATTAAESRTGGIALTSAIAGQALSFVGDGAILDLGDALAALTYDDDVYLSDTDGVLADVSGTVTKLVGRVVPGNGVTTPDKLLQVRMSDAIDVAFDIAKSNLPVGFLQADLIAGGAAGAHTVTGMAVGDEIVFVGMFVTAASIATLSDITAEFTAGVNDANNAAGTNSTNNQLLILWIDRTP